MINFNAFLAVNFPAMFIPTSMKVIRHACKL
jgi:hypothetical protein